MQTKKTLRILVVIAAVVATILICRFVAQRSATPQPLTVEGVRKQLETADSCRQQPISSREGS